ncbi:hypothetical protein [Spongiibacter pelagi]|nr:hypothetical protein [Spongiibacter pelagi]
MLAEQLPNAMDTEETNKPESYLVSREPWWAEPPKPGQSELGVEWGYLEVYSDGEFRFVRERPSLEEIESRISCHYMD